MSKAYLLQPALDLVHEAFATIFVVPTRYLLGHLVPVFDVTIVGWENDKMVNRS